MSTIEIIVIILASLGLVILLWWSHCYHRDRMLHNNAVGKHCKFYLGEDKYDGIVLYSDAEFTTVRNTYDSEIHVVPTSQIYAPWL